MASVACQDSNVPFLTAPTSVAALPAGIQNALGGLFAGTRIDMTMGISGFISIAVGMARDGAVFTNTEPRTVQYPTGVLHFPATSGSVWAQEYTNIRQAQQILAALPNVSPAYSAAQLASLQGVVQTLIAYNYMLVAEAHDTLGLALLSPNVTLATPPAAVCLKDAWSYIAAYLDTAEKNLETAGSVAPPIALPNGFQGVGAASGPPRTVGSFALFNRALAAKAHSRVGLCPRADDPGHGSDSRVRRFPQRRRAQRSAGRSGFVGDVRLDRKRARSDRVRRVQARRAHRDT